MASLTCLRRPLLPEAGHCHLAAGRQQQRSTFVHHRPVGQDGLQRLLQEAQRLLRDSQHQLEEGRVQSITHTHTHIYI